MGPCAASVETDGALIARISGGGETLSVIPVSNATNLNGVGAGQVIGTYIASDTAETGSTTTVINATAHVAKVGDWIQMVSSAAPAHEWSTVSAIAANTITVAQAFTTAPVNGNTFYILRPKPAQGNSGGTLWVDIQSGQQSANATGLLKLEDVASASGDAGVAVWSIRNTALGTPAADGDYQGIASGTFGNVLGSIVYDGNISGQSQVVRPEDTGFADTQPLMMSGAVNNRSRTSFNTTNGDVLPIGAGDMGNVLTSPIFDVNITNGAQTIRLEDDVFTNGDALTVIGGQSLSAIAQTVGTSGDVAPPAMDLGNRLVTTNAPAGETWWSCTGEITTATNTQLKASVASNRHYITSFGCAATSTNPNQIYLTDGSGGAAMDLVTTTSNAVAPSVQNTYPIPLRGSSATAVFVTTITTGAVRCCAAGYISTI